MRYPIVVGTDLSEASDDALIQAEARARRDQSPLTVVHVMPQMLWRPSNEADEGEGIRRQLAQQVTALTGRSENDFEVAVERGSTHAVLARIARSQHALLVVGSHMQRGLGHALIRDVTQRVVWSADGPVLVTRPRARSGRILVAVKMPNCPATVLDVAIEEADSSQASLVVLHCIDSGFVESDPINGGAYPARTPGQRALLVEARRTLAAELQRRGVDCEMHVIEGDPQTRIAEVAAGLEAELVVIGTTRRPAPTPHVTRATLRRAPCSVLVVDDGLRVATVRPPLYADV